MYHFSSLRGAVKGRRARLRGAGASGGAPPCKVWRGEDGGRIRKAGKGEERKGKSESRTAVAAVTKKAFVNMTVSVPLITRFCGAVVWLYFYLLLSIALVFVKSI